MTNHAVVAIVDDDVKQTRCATCDAEHEYRQAKTPTPRRSKSQAALADAGDGGKPVLAPPRPPVEPEPAADLPPPQVPEVPAAVSAPAVPPAENLMAVDAASEAAPPHEVAPGPDPREDDGPVHRPLIRATFPRPEGQVPERREPEFTVRQPGGRGRGEVDGNRAGYRSTSGRNQRHGQPGGFSNFGSRPAGGFGSDGQRGGRGPGGGRGDNRQGGGGQNRGQRHGGGDGRKGGR